MEGGRLHRLWLKPAKSIFKSGESSAARQGRLEVGLNRTWFETAWDALFSRVLQSWGAAEAEENFTAKYTKCSFNPMSMMRLPSTPSQACEARCTWHQFRGLKLKTTLYLGVNSAVFGETRWFLWEIQWYLRQIQCYGRHIQWNFWREKNGGILGKCINIWCKFSGTYIRLILWYYR